MHDLHFNWITILVSTVIGFVIGGVWYAPPVLGNRWLALIGKTREELGPQAVPTALQGVVILVMAIVLAVFVSWSGANSYKTGALVGVVAWAGFSFTTAWAGAIAEKRPPALLALNSGYHLVALVVMGAIIAHWQ